MLFLFSLCCTPLSWRVAWHIADAQLTFAKWVNRYVSIFIMTLAFFPKKFWLTDRWMCRLKNYELFVSKRNCINACWSTKRGVIRKSSFIGNQCGSNYFLTHLQSWFYSSIWREGIGLLTHIQTWTNEYLFFVLFLSIF